MTWYTAYAISWIRFKDGEQDCFPLQEDLLLISAQTPEQAIQKAETIARDRYEGDDNGSFRCDGRPAERHFVGIRRLIQCDDPTEQPTDGTEVTYQFLQVNSRDQLDALLANRDVVVELQGDDEPEA